VWASKKEQKIMEGARPAGPHVKLMDPADTTQGGSRHCAWVFGNAKRNVRTHAPGGREEEELFDAIILPSFFVYPVPRTHKALFAWDQRNPFRSIEPTACNTHTLGLAACCYCDACFPFSCCEIFGRISLSPVGAMHACMILFVLCFACNC